MNLFDSHCHLQDDRITRNVKEIIGRAEKAGVTAMLCCGSCEDDWEAVLNIAGKYDAVIPALGIHPWFASGRTGEWMNKLRALLERDPKTAVGEIGLDHTVADRNDADQRELFREQLLLARQYDRSVSIHCRKAWGSLMDIFRGEPDLGVRSVIHSYSGPVELVEELQGYGVSLSFSGSITLPNNRRGRKAVARVAPGHLLVETDAPDIVPAGRQGPNEPAALCDVVRTAAQLRKSTFEETAELTFGNAGALFGYPGSVPEE